MNFLDIHTHQTAQQPGITSIQSLSLTNDVFLAMPKKKPISIGLHPWYATLANLDLQMKYLTVVAKQSNVKLIGECGLDKLKGESIDNQMLILAQQIKLAEELQKPIILHCVKAFDELLALKKYLKVKVPMIIHGFNKNAALGEQLQANGFLLSIGSSVLKESNHTAQLLQQTANFFLETDDSGISIVEIYHAVADLKKCTVEELKACIFANWKKLNLV